ncbi:uncharacterized protein LOC132169985 [Corylus avellana]|uniref:uncharacterized protein LOC132169985 n=1 Tax=Corylus avellana TaxID=13451 RepID=UPI00286B257B|nr:uncharacterized protein LOC132169985 [Corylus avellana]
MAEDLSKLWGKLSLDEGEMMEVAIQPRMVEGVVSRGKFCVVGKLLTDCFVGKDIIKRTLIKGWRPTGSLSFKVLGENVFILEFENEWDKARVLEGRPWIFEGNLFSVEEFDGQSSPSKIIFEQAAFWVRMFNLPLACMGKEVGQQIGATMWTMEEVDTDEEGVGWGKFLRVKIRIDLTKPLPRGRVINLLGKQTLIAFQYEKLPKYCFDCGKIWHGQMGCTVQGGNRPKEMEKQYGPWMRVPSLWRRRDFPTPRFFEQQGEGMREDDKSHAGIRGNRRRSSKYHSESDKAAASQAEESTKEKSPVIPDETPASGERAVTDEGSINGRGADSGVNKGAFTGGISVSGQAESPAVKGNNKEDAQEVLLGEENFLKAVRELKLKGKEVSMNANGLSNKGEILNEKTRKERTKEESHQPVQVNVVNENEPRGESTKEKLNGGGGDQAHGTLKWKRSARAGQQWPSEAQQASPVGKRKILGGLGAQQGDEKGVQNRRLKYKGEREFVLRDEDGASINGSGMAGSGSQPCRPA